MLLDTASLYFRAFFGVPDTMKAADGTPTNAIRGLLDFIARLAENHRPTHLVACWDDNWRPSWRVALIPSYKAQRVEFVTPKGEQVEDVPDRLEVQVPYIRACLEAIGIAVVGAPDHEADDVIGTLSRDAGMPVDVVTGDRDLFQLVDDAAEVRVLYIARGVGRHERVTNSVVQEKYGIHGHQYADFAALRGDASDGLPGVSGIGEKTAATLLQRFGDIPGLRAAAADPDSNIAPSPRRRIVEAGDYPEVAAHVTRVARDLDLGTPDLTLPLSPVDPEALVKLSDQWNLESPIARLVETLTDLRSR
jgi:5'-3' exonuclease